MKNLEKNGKTITCILNKGAAIPLLQALYEKGVTRANFAFARGFDIHDIDNPKTGFPDAEEKEIVTVVAKDEVEGEDLFNFIFEKANINRLGGGLLFMSTLKASSPYMLPKIDESMAAAADASAPSPTL